MSDEPMLRRLKRTHTCDMVPIGGTPPPCTSSARIMGCRCHRLYGDQTPIAGEVAGEVRVDIACPLHGFRVEDLVEALRTADAQVSRLRETWFGETWFTVDRYSTFSTVAATEVEVWWDDFVGSGKEKP